MYGIIKKISQFDLFDKGVLPVLHVLYGSEVWGYENLDVFERIHLNFLCPIENFCNCRSIDNKVLSDQYLLSHNYDINNYCWYISARVSADDTE